MRYIIVALMLFVSSCDSNSKIVYGKTGFPKNCRAIIKENIDGWRMQKYTAEDALNSIDRNCGEFGYSW